MKRLPTILRLKHSYATDLLILVILMLMPPVNLQAGGRYRIVADEDGVLFQTESEGGWYISEEDQYLFAPGQTGRYTIGSDSKGRYLATEHGRFYLDDQGGEDFASDSGIPDASQGQSLPLSKETKVIMAGQHVLVPVLIRHQGRSLELHLLLDTGASIITLHKESIQRLRFNKKQTASFTTAAGRRIDADLVRLEEVRFGPFSRHEVLAGIIEHQEGSGVNYDGLLGMNVLKDLTYEIDFDKGVIRWRRNE
jgi:clan AA aspartic protease (TIGR02281 family)